MEYFLNLRIDHLSIFQHGRSRNGLDVAQTFAANKPPPPHVAYKEVLVSSEAVSEAFL